MVPLAFYGQSARGLVPTRRPRPVPASPCDGAGRASLLTRQSLLAPLPPQQKMDCSECGAATLGNAVETFYGTGIGPEYLPRPCPYPHLRALACSWCGRIVVVCQGEQYPPARPDRDEWEFLRDQDVPDYVVVEYRSALRSLRARAYSPTAMVCRKLLMSMPVSLGAKSKKGYLSYVDYLYENGYINWWNKGWVTAIRDYGNDANHSTTPVGRRRAAISLMLTTELLRWIYEHEYRPPEYYDGFCGH